jgi:hypothetical protein
MNLSSTNNAIVDNINYFQFLCQVSFILQNTTFLNENLQWKINN